MASNEPSGGLSMPTANDLLNAVLTGLGIGGLFAVIALGLSLVFGVMRLMNLAHGEFIVLGAYIVYYLGSRPGSTPGRACSSRRRLVALLAYPLQHYALSPVMSRGAEAPLLITFGVSVILQNLFIVGVHRRRALAERGLRVGERQICSASRMPVIYIICLVVAVVLLAATHLIVTRTGFGRRLRASSEDAVAAAVMGVNVRRMYSMTYALAAGSAAHRRRAVGLTFSFAPTTGTAYLVTGFAVVVLGGVGSVKGTLLGGLHARRHREHRRHVRRRRVARLHRLHPRADRALGQAAGPLRQREGRLMAAPSVARAARGLVPRTRSQLVTARASVAVALVVALVAAPYMVDEYYMLGHLPGARSTSRWPRPGTCSPATAASSRWRRPPPSASACTPPPCSPTTSASRSRC